MAAPSDVAEVTTDTEPSVVTFADLLARASRIARQGERRLLGVTGAPGAGKSTLAGALVRALGPQRAALVPMDGFHLANPTLEAWGRRDRKGAPDTFDADGFVALLRRLRRRAEPVVHAPLFDRTLDTSVGSALPVPRDVPLVVTEGNYLLLDTGPWAELAGLLDEVWYLDVDPAVRLERLVDRHERHGRTAETALAWATGPDETNARLVARTRLRAHLVVRLAAGEHEQS